MSRPALSLLCRSCQQRWSRTVFPRSFSTSAKRWAEETHEEQKEQAPAEDTAQIPTAEATARPPTADAPVQISEKISQLARTVQAAAADRPQAGVSPNEPYHLNVFTHKHNTHITFTEPSRTPILSFSSGNIGLRKGQRGTFDAGYQLAAYTMRKIAEKSWRIGGKKSNSVPLTLNDSHIKERGIEIIFRGYGPGREAFQKAILGSEGRMLKPLVKRVTDGTRTKFGGTRSPAVRRLG